MSSADCLRPYDVWQRLIPSCCACLCWLVPCFARPAVAIAETACADSPTFAIDNRDGETACADSPAFAIDNRGGSGLRLTTLRADYAGVFAEGVDLTNTVTATVDWAGKQPEKVVFDLNGAAVEVPTSGTTAENAYNMGLDLVYSLAGDRNELAARAVAADGSTSAPLRLYFWGLALPQWATSIETRKGPIGFRTDPLSGKVAFYGQVEALAGGVQATVNVPGGIPEVGGSWGLQIDPLNFNWELAAHPRFGDGAGLTGSFQLGGKWGAQAACGGNRKGAISAAVAGAGDFYPEFRLTDASADLAGSFEFLFPRVPLLCQWTGCCHTGYCPYFQASIKPAVIGTVAMEEGQPELVAGLKFKNAELNIAVTLAGTVGAGSEGSIYHIAGTIGGKPYLILQFPGDASSACLNEYIKEVGFDLEARFVVEALAWKVEEQWTFNIYRCPDPVESYAVHARSDGQRRVVPVAREYLDAPEGYCVFPNLKGDVAAESVGGLPAPILNVGTAPTPSVDAVSDAGLLLFVYDDAGKPTGKHQEIYYARWDGAAWTAHAPLTDNLGPDIQPVAVIDSAGTQVAAWVSAPEPAGTETGPRDIIPGCEISFARYDAVGGAWTVPAQLTTNAYADLLPWFEELPPGGLRVCWIASPTNAIPVWHDEEIAPSLDVMAADWDGAAFGAPYAIVTGLQAVSPPSITRSDTHEFLAYLKDTDSNSGTAQDREVVLRSRLIGGAWGADQQLTSDSLSDTAAQVTMDEAGLPIVTWVKRMVPTTLPDMTETHVDQLWFARWNGSAWDAPVLAMETDGIAEPRLFRNDAGKPVLFWVAASQEFSDIFYSVFDSARNQWGPAQQVTHDEAAETMIALAESGGNILAAYVKRRVDLSDPSGLPQIGLSDLYLLEHVPVRDLSVSSDDISLEPAPARGEVSTVCADVRLNGDFTVETVAVDFYDGDPDAGGTLIGSDTIDVLLPGEARSACVPWTIPDDDQKHLLYAIVDPANTIPETDEVGNNKASVGLFEPDLRISMPSVLGYPNADTVLLGFTVRNDGAARAGASTCQVRDGGPGGDVIYSAALEELETAGSASVQVTWDVSGVPAGTYTLALVADSGGQVDEVNEANNIALLETPVMPDLKPEPWSVKSATRNTYLTVRNVGAKPSTPTTVRVTHEGLPVGEAAVPALDAAASADVVVPITATAPQSSLEIVVNPDSTGTDEVTLLNNEAPATVQADPDFDADGDVDSFDFLTFSNCFNGSLKPPPAVCANLNSDLDGDGDVDTFDFLTFSNCFNGSLNPPACP